jgi:hypothetical protein
MSYFWPVALGDAPSNLPQWLSMPSIVLSVLKLASTPRFGTSCNSITIMEITVIVSATDTVFFLGSSARTFTWQSPIEDVTSWNICCPRPPLIFWKRLVYWSIRALIRAIDNPTIHKYHLLSVHISLVIHLVLTVLDSRAVNIS